LSQRLAEWRHEHHLNWAVTRLEQTQYDLHKPRTGGALVGGIPTASGEKAAVPAAPKVPHTPAPVALTPFVGKPAPAEGKWQSVVFDHGLPAVRMTYPRPDEGYTSYLAAVMWLDPKLLTGRLHEGRTDPGGSETTPDHITPDLAKTVAAAMPGEFRTNNGPVGNRSGYDDQGKVAEPLRTGAATLVVHACGAVTIGPWGRDASMGPAVRSVRQNLDLLVDGGTVNPTCASGSTPLWGYGANNDAYVPRTGIGQRPDRALVFVNSPVTSVCSLGRLLKAAGAVRAMQLDINYDWSIGYYSNPKAAPSTATSPELTRAKAPTTTSPPKAATSSPSSFAETVVGLPPATSRAMRRRASVPQRFSTPCPMLTERFVPVGYGVSEGAVGLAASWMLTTQASWSRHSQTRLRRDLSPRPGPRLRGVAAAAKGTSAAPWAADKAPRRSAWTPTRNGGRPSARSAVRPKGSMHNFTATPDCPHTPRASSP